MSYAWKKTLLAAAVMAVSASAMAEEGSSSVSIYGRIDTAVESLKVGKTRVNQLSNGSSYFGFTGTEDLGNGLKVGFVLESSFNSDTGENSDPEAFFNNGSELFLESDLGTLRLGRFYNPSYYAIADPVSLHNEDAGVTLDYLYAGVENPSNRVAYKTPDLDGFSAEVAVSLNEKNPDYEKKNAYDLALNYEVGSWSFGAGYGKWAKAKQYALRATWSDGPWTVSGYHQRSKNWNAFDYVVDVDAGSYKATRVAVAYALGEGEIHANVGRASGPDRQSAMQWTLGYNYHLSKRTKLYAFYTTIQNKHGAHFGPEAVEADDDLKGLTFGIRHLF